MDEFYNADDPASIHRFNAMLSEYYLNNQRPMPWREYITPYRVVVSEIMLQQTQVSRVIDKFPRFIQTFPDFHALSCTSLEDVMRAWQGLGYNRRAKYLREISGVIVEQWNGIVPDDPDILKTFPGIGAATAGSITAFAYNRPIVFIETNIRRVFIHHFFRDRVGVPDKEIIPVVSRALNGHTPREWYYSLMDYGTFLAGRVVNPNRRSRHYVVQSPFPGSDREMRGQIIKYLLEHGPIRYQYLIEKIGDQESRTRTILSQMITEGLIIQDHTIIRFP